MWEEGSRRKNRTTHLEKSRSFNRRAAEEEACTIKKREATPEKENWKARIFLEPSHEREGGVPSVRIEIPATSRYDKGGKLREERQQSNLVKTRSWWKNRT